MEKILRSSFMNRLGFPVLGIFMWVGLLYLILVVPSPCFAGNVFTSEQVDKMLQKDCNITTDYILLFDEVYEEYPLMRALGKTDCTNHFYSSNLYDCDDIAFSVKAIVTRHIHELHEKGGAVMFGVAGIKKIKEIDSGHMVNICIYENKVYIYDQQIDSDKNFNPAEKYLKAGYKFTMIIM